MTEIYERPVDILQSLIRFDTTNPPGNEAACVNYIKGLLQDAGIESTIVARTPERPNLIARLPGEGSEPALLFYGHVDVVPTANQDWQHPPFSADIVDGFVWGRGTLDMKGGVAMLVSNFLRAKAENLKLPGDLILTILSDEEAGGDFGAKFLVENHPELFAGARYAIGEFGGFPQYVAGKCFYPIMIAEKTVCWMKTSITAPGGHGSLPYHGGAMARLGHILQTLDQNRLPVHIIPEVQRYIEALADASPESEAALLRRLLDPEQTDAALDEMGESGRMLDSMLHNTVNATVVQGGSKTNVIPGEITLELDGRLLPGFTPDDIFAEIQALVGDDITFEIIRYDPDDGSIDMGLFPMLAEILTDAHPGSIPVPLLLFGGTDGRFFSRLGIQTYGFLPMSIPEEINFLRLIHAADERIPVEAVEFGTNAIYEVLKRMAR